MDISRVAAVLIVAGFVLFAAASVLVPSGLYREPDHAARLSMIDAQFGRFLAAQVLFALGMAAPAAGFALLSLRVSGPAWTSPLAAVAIVIGALAGIAFVSLQTVDPQRFWLDGQALWLSAVAVGLTLPAVALYGVLLLQSNAPAWMGYLLVGYAVVGGVALVALKAPAFFVLFGFYLVAIGPAVVLWRSGLE